MFHINLDLSEIASIPEELKPAMDRAVKKAGQELAAQTRGHIVEQASQKLHTRREMFVENLHHYKVNDDTWIIHLDAKAVWIDDGLPMHNMLNDLLKSDSAKTAKDGSRYVVVPFEQGPKGKTQMTPAQANLLDTIKTELRQREIPYSKIEKNEDGSPKLGKLHSFDITHAPIKTANAPGQGKGPIGAVMQGPGVLSHGDTRMTGTPLLQGISIYQSMVKDKKGKEKVKRSIMTFRVASSKHSGGGRWDHPGLPPTNLMNDGYEWAKNQWEKVIAPKLVEEVIGSL